MTRRDIERMTVFNDGTTGKAGVRHYNVGVLRRLGFKPYGRMCLSGHLHVERKEDHWLLIYGVRSAIKGGNGNYKYFGLVRRYNTRIGLKNILIKLQSVLQGSEKCIWRTLD